MGRPLDSVILSRRRRISVRDEYEVIGILAGAWYSAPSRRLVFNGIPLLTILTEILRFAQDDGGRREDIEAAPVMGRPLDSVILNAVKNLGAWRI